MGRHRELSARILRSIVIAGAMIGTPLATAQPKQPAAKTDDARQRFELQRQLEAAKNAMEKAQTDADRAAAKAKIATLQAQIAALDATTDARGKLAELQKELVELDKKVSAAVDAVVASQTEADRAAAKAKLDQLRALKADLEKKIAAVRDPIAACMQQLADKQWADAIDCGTKVKATDAKMGEEMVARATAESKAEAAMRSMRNAITNKNLPAAKTELDKIALDSVYRKDAQAAYDAAVKAQKRPRAGEERPVGRGFVLA
jgi:capsule polysaccharide export protein KpsE/RkpR